jgi:hypothetical protein
VNLKRQKKSDKLFTVEDFLPNYLGEKKPVIEKSLEEQRKDWGAFKKHYHKVRKEAGLE